MNLPDAHQNLQVLHIGTEEPRAYYIPLDSSDWRTFPVYRLGLGSRSI